MLVKNTNTYEARHHMQLKATWKDMSKSELRGFLSILIYRSLYLPPRHKDFWNTDMRKLIHIELTNVMSHDCFAQLEASFHVSDPDI